MRSWLAIFLLIPKKFGEAISNFLIEQGASGIEEIDEDLNWERVKAYFLQDGKEGRVLRALPRYLKSIQRIHPEFSHFKLEITSIPEQDWGENWKRFFKPFKVTPRLVVRPPWSKIRPKRGRISIEINPGMAFGTGTHATTKLCLRALEGVLQKKGFSVLDVGTGSGILSIVAARLGAKEVLGLDIDGVAVENARENVKKNSVSNIVKIGKGRIGDIQKRFNVVVANIDLRSLRRMRMPLLRHLTKKGFLILAGILEGEKERFRQHYLKTGLLKLVKMAQEGEWVCFIFKKKQKVEGGK